MTTAQTARLAQLDAAGFAPVSLDADGSVVAVWSLPTGRAGKRLRVSPDGSVRTA